MDNVIDIKGNVEKVLEVIERTATRAGRKGESIKLVAISKTVEIARIRQALEAGVIHIGENRVQEGMAKKPQLADLSMVFHLVGPLQKNKANKAVETFDWIETLDSVELAAKLNQACERLNKTLPVLIEVNIGNEPSKSGMPEVQVPGLLKQVCGFKRLSIRGLMTVPPYFEDPEEVRPYFVRLRELSQRLADLKLENVSMNELSMGMSHDYPVAIEEGATLIRVGTAIFGARQ